MSVAEKVWDRVRGDEPKYAEVGPDFRAKLDHAEAMARAGQRTDIAGLEKFEDALAGEVKVDGDASARVGSPSLTEGAKEEAVPSQPKGSGAQEGSEAKAAKDAKGAQQKVISDEVNSPSYPSAARPLAAETPVNTPKPRSKGAASKTAAKSSAKSAAKSGAKKAGK